MNKHYYNDIHPHSYITPFRTVMVLAALIVFGLLAFSGSAEAQTGHYWTLQAKSQGVSAFGQPTTICYWRCSAHGDTRITQGNFGMCSQPSSGF